MNTPLRLEGEDVPLGLSMGIALAPEDGDDPDTLFKHADVALYQAKGEGRGGYRFYDPALHATLRVRREMRADLGSAIERGELSIAYQPKIHCATGKLAGAEALLRWAHPERGMIPPAEFIPVAEKTGQIVAIGAWVLRAVCAQIARWLAAGLPTFPVAVNVSIAQLREAGFVEQVAEIIGQAGIPPGCLELEVTESMMMDNPARARQTLMELRRLGVTISIDDFGTGYSCLAYLSELPVDKLKIDQSLVASLARDGHGEQVTAAIISLGKNLKLDVIAEGVETTPQFEFLKSHECDDVQGFFFSPAVAADEFVAWMASQEAPPRVADGGGD
jgi:EAL domain-containing protein (putative c-di-GMP-specific phosphodiesterase class I)